MKVTQTQTPGMRVNSDVRAGESLLGPFNSQRDFDAAFKKLEFNRCNSCLTDVLNTVTEECKQNSRNGRKCDIWANTYPYQHANA